MIFPAELKQQHRYRGEHTIVNSLADYIRLLNLEIRPGQKILDVGASAGRFAAEVNRYWQNNVVVDSLDMFDNDDVRNGTLKFSSPEAEQEFRKNYWENNRIKGNIVQGTPTIPDQTYDQVVSMFAIPTWVANYQDTVSAIREMLRVCKKGGVIRLYPMWLNSQGLYDGFDTKDNLEKTIEVLEKAGCPVVLETVERNEESNDTGIRITIYKDTETIPKKHEFHSTFTFLKQALARKSK